MEKVDWENAINIRRSTRSFQIRSLEMETMDRLQSFVNDMRTPFKHDVTIRIFKANPNKKLYTAFTAPPDGAAFLSKTDACSISATGFVGEMFVLYATSLGIATCWYGHYTLAELEQIMPHLGVYAQLSTNPKWGYGKGMVQGKRAICITPLGYWRREGVRVFDRMQESLISFKRKPVKELFEGNIDVDKLPPEIFYGFDLARKAPSAANSQHWRFTVSPDLKKISIAMPVGYKHVKWEHPDVDIGICACHFWLGLTSKGVSCDVSLTEEKGRAVWYFKLE
ncbi:MAG: hypothetical protein FH756_17505 [Firmicutes bacterium]|nr:hypothetical protein [Bacillota bacterium]